MSAQYFFANGNEQRGPYSVEQLAALGLRPDTLVWREGLAEWVPLDSLSELTALIPVAPVVAHPPPPLMNPSNPYVASPTPIRPLSYEGPIPGQSAAAGGFTIASLVLGIIGLLSMCGFHVGGIIGIPCSILAVVFGHIGKAKAERGETGGRGMAIAGLTCGYIYIGLVALVILLVLFGVGLAIIGR